MESKNTPVILAGEQLPDYFSGAEEIAARAFSVLGQSESFAFSLIAPSAEEMREINRESRGVDAPTDVLSFPALSGLKAGEKPTRKKHPYEWDESIKALFIGDILICPAVIEPQAAEIGNTNRGEFCYMLVHGLLHLLGYDHNTETDKAAMRAAEKEILEKWTK